MKVLKFGGTSVGSAENIRNVIDILRSNEQPCIVVFSALSGITNQLVDGLNLAASRDDRYCSAVDFIEQKHFDIANELLNPKNASATLAQLRLITNKLRETFDGIYHLGENTSRSSDLVLSFGEILSLQLLNAILKEQFSSVHSIDAREIIFTKPFNGVELLAAKETEEAIKNKFGFDSPLTTLSGFISSSTKGYPSTLGRGGSDYTAAIVASALNADVLEIWTDVSGIFTSDPSITENAFPIAELSYAEALELSHFGAKVIYAPTIYPVLQKQIPVLVKNTFDKDAMGTLISAATKSNGSIVKAITSINGICLISLTGSGIVGVVGIASRMFGALASANINVILITQASSEQSICIAIDEKMGERAIEALNQEFEFELQMGRVKSVQSDYGFSIIAIVGEKMHDSVGVSGQAFAALGRNGVNIHAIAQGSSELNVSMVVKQNDCSKAVNAIHQEFFHSVNRVVNLFVVGVGNVGKAFINQIASQSNFFKSTYRVEFRVVGIANSQKMKFDSKGIDIEGWHHEASSMKADQFIQQMVSMNLSNSIFIDNTASEEISGFYADILSKSIPVVTCNKIAASSDYENYSRLKRIALEKRTYFKFESNVGAGLPIIQTINNLIKTGDQVNSIEAVVSGSLNCIFNGFCKGLKFSEAVLKAKNLGLTEPNPYIDLQGIDVARKLLILVRESGIRIESSDIEFMGFLPFPLPNSYNPELFGDQIREYDNFFESIRKRIDTERTKLRFVAEYRNGKAMICLKEVDSKHPLYTLEESDNVITLYTNRYVKNPLVIKGAGAGAEVTASGIFSDILSIINH